MIEFIKQPGFYHVEIDGVYRGRVRRVEDWTVRGTRVRWQAETKNGRVLGSAPTRKEAAQFFPLVETKRSWPLAC